MTKQRIRETHDLLGDIADIHQIPGQYEAGNAQQHERIDAAVEFLQHDDQRDTCQKQIGQRGQTKQKASRLDHDQ
ncbi:MAG: hypothetical protein PF501_15125 [Salinisphaera sp.]|jgi:hypothetical protein|nr:hypothetical protein [Salinisphaera sp.]